MEYKISQRGSNRKLWGVRDTAARLVGQGAGIILGFVESAEHTFVRQRGGEREKQVQRHKGEKFMNSTNDK